MSSERVAGSCSICGVDILIYGKGCSPERAKCNPCTISYIPDEGDTFFAPKGECSYCDNQRTLGSRYAPSHNASSGCKSGGYNHCTCDSCF